VTLLFKSNWFFLNELVVLYKHCFQGGEFEDKEPDAFDLFKLCHFSKKKRLHLRIIGYRKSAPL
jgi:hypothetical protein